MTRLGAWHGGLPWLLVVCVGCLDATPEPQLSYVGKPPAASPTSGAESPPVSLSSANWTFGEELPLSGRPNPYGWGAETLERRRHRGAAHVASYPVDISAALIPLHFLEQLVDAREGGVLLKLVRNAVTDIDLHSMDRLEAWLGLPEWPSPEDGENAPNPLPPPSTRRPAHRLGTTFIETQHGTAVTYGCPACHAGTLFGKPWVGLPSRIARANRMFALADDAFKVLPLTLTTAVVGGTAGDLVLLRQLRDATRYLETKSPQALGMDTSLAQIALSLSRRAPDAWASKEAIHALFPREEPLRHVVADGRPLPWWNVKYKNRWLSDGSLIAGNPILTNFLWNELGRGTDLRSLEAWLTENEDVVKDLTTYVFSNEAPRYEDVLGAGRINEASAKRGEVLFVAACTRCHGEYDKAWSRPDADALPAAGRLRTVEVRYHPQTPVLDVGTDLQRARGMKSLEQLNRLALSQNFGIQVEAQEGYVPPPLVGVWARWPYFHNGSAPTLCSVLTRADARPTTWYVGRELNPETDFDLACNGFPSPDRAPPTWRDAKNLYDTARSGASNRGHDEGIFLHEGRELFTPAQKRDLVEFLKTL